MRRICSMGVFSVSMIAVVCSFAANVPSGNSRIVYGLDKAPHFSAASGSRFYIQAGIFKVASNAKAFKQQLIKQYHHPVMVKTSGQYNRVLIGPFDTAAQARAIKGSSMLVVVVSASTPHPQTAMTDPASKAIARTTSHVVLADKDGLEPTSADHFEVIAAGSAGGFNAGYGSMGITNTETDALSQTNRNNWNAPGGQFGIGYIYYLRNAQPYSEELQWFAAIEPEINAYYQPSNNAVKGRVLRNRNADLAYTMPIQSARLMFDGALTVASKKNYSLYAKGGVGNAWNRVGYNDRDNAYVTRLDLNPHTNSSFAWEAGAGMAYAFNDYFGLSLEYLYAGLGRITTPVNGNAAAVIDPVLVPARLSLNGQTGLLGLHVAM